MTSILPNVISDRLQVIEIEMKTACPAVFSAYLAQTASGDAVAGIDVSEPESLTNVLNDEAPPDFKQLPGNLHECTPVIESDGGWPKMPSKTVLTGLDDEYIHVHQVQNPAVVVSDPSQKSVVATPWKLFPGYSLNYQAQNGQLEPIYAIDSQAANRIAPHDKGDAVRFEAILPKVMMEWGLKSESNSRFIANLLAGSKLGYESIENKFDSSIGHAVSASTFQWTKQMLFLTPSPDGSQTVWIRDYTMTNAEINEIISLIKSTASECSINLDRIMVNGHEIWSRHSTAE